MILKEYKKAIIISVLLHLVMLAILLWGQLFSSSHKKPVGRMVEAVVIDPKLIEQQAKAIRAERETVQKTQQDDLEKQREQAELEEEKRQQELEKQRLEKEKAVEAQKQAIEQKQQQKAEQERLAQQEAAKKAEAEQRAKEEAAKKAEAEKRAKEEAAKKAEAEKRAQEEAAKKAEAEKRAQEEAAKKAAAEKRAQEEAAKKAAAEKRAQEEAAKKAAAEKAEAEKRAKEEAAKKAAAAKASEQAVLDDIFSGMESDTNQVSVAKQKQIATEVDRYAAIYKQMIQERLIIDDAFRGKSCRINIRLLQSGGSALVGKLTIQGGDAQLCSATKNAVAQVPSFPMPNDQSIANQLKDINLTVEPQ
ncbi:MAG: cell envelope integrity protein TolA [Vibrio sp.]